MKKETTTATAETKKVTFADIRNELKTITNKCMADLDMIKWAAEYKERTGYKMPKNYLLALHYGKLIECTTFKTFEEWSKQGRSVIKGAKGFWFWGKPQTNEEKGTFFPIVKMFAETQTQSTSDFFNNQK